MRSGDRDHPGQHGETPSLIKYKKISWAWWYKPVVPGTLGGRGRRIAWAQEFETSLGNVVKPCLYEKYKKLTRRGGTCLWS